MPVQLSCSRSSARGALLLPLVAGALLQTSVARADEVTLTNGSMYRGEIMERVKDDHVTIKLATGEIKQIPWAEIDPSSRGGAAQVSLESDGENTALMRLSQTGTGFGYAGGRAMTVSFESYEPVCVAPCRAAADPNATYIVGGEGVAPSRNFRLPREGDIALRAHVGSASKRAWGSVALLAGVAGLASGSAYAFMGSVFTPDANDPKYMGKYVVGDFEQDNNRASTFKTLGYIGLGAGAALLALGIYLVSTGATDVFAGRTQIAGRAPKLTLTPAGFLF